MKRTAPGKVFIPQLPGPKTVSEMAIYVKEFDRLNGLKPLAYSFRGEVIQPRQD